jgi:ferredoxin-type protein NapH
VKYQAQEGLLTTTRSPWRNRGAAGWAISIGLVTFYCLLYWTDLFERPAQLLHLRHKWFLYGALYSVAMVGGGIAYLRRHGNSRYHQVRIATNVAIQIVLAFSLPYVLAVFEQPEVYLSYLWPLAWKDVFPWTLQGLPPALALWSVVGAFVIAPVASLVFGKRWYCSWVCGCGALANTFGDPWRHLTSKSAASWRFERIAVHTSLLTIGLLTAVVVVAQLLDFRQPGLAAAVEPLKKGYGFVFGAVLSGVVGTGLYPVLGPRVWCRNFCPMAAVLGLTQKIGRFRIRVKPDMCISCGNCTTYCEMGIDVRAYAQTNESFTRASCVGCGMCAHVCPRGVLKLENA